jgi:hypothetical protein
MDSFGVPLTINFGITPSIIDENETQRGLPDLVEFLKKEPLQDAKLENEAP